MLFLSENNAARNVPMNVTKVKGRAVLRHEDVKLAVKARVVEYSGRLGDELSSTTMDGLDMVWAMMVPARVRADLAVVHDWIGFVNCNSGKQSSALYGGVCAEDHSWALVFSKYKLASRRDPWAMNNAVQRAVEKWSLVRDEYFHTYRSLCSGYMSPSRVEYLTLELAREGSLSWKKMAMIDSLWDKEREYPIDFLKRMCKAVAKHPPVSQCPGRNQLSQMYTIFKKVVK